MAYWGLAYAIGPNYNRPWDLFELEEKAAALTEAHGALDAAQALTGLTPVEDALIAVFVEAGMNRTPWQLWDLRSGTPTPGATTDEARSVLERAFAAGEAAWDHPGVLGVDAVAAPCTRSVVDGPGPLQRCRADLSGRPWTR